MKIVSRIAPTPSGLLHLGNSFNFLMTYLLTKNSNGLIHLRIDDYDQGRVRDEFIQDIFDSIAWLGIKIDQGPKNLIDFKKN